MANIEKDVPMPVTVSTNGGRSRFPWKDMEVGDSFVVSGEGRGGQPRKGPPGAPKALRDEGRVFVTAPEGDGYRVWRKA